ncbi:RNA polymerase ECF family sigma subunit [Actinomadura pelletieri DSM 43383]|uniref:RNA polymerase sigma factor n=1 Tax=Actinomadura pelletieri DSM 43383 TaxID=1120940 RepID=A0A495QIZ6_9ACTN|nr:sigma-70 family RNA polymerase sigma factor [Actinomadura pelletieri]RKS72117.1 RNA polymerase ECF family sigma subunit [Actinomadura pelletieri DSM 43383]
MSETACRVCGKPLPTSTGRPGRASLYCSPACRQKAYRTRQAPTNGTVHDLISDIERQVRALTPERPHPFYSAVKSLSSSVGRLHHLARTAAQSVTQNPVTNPDDAEAARTSDEWSFAALVEPYRRELQVHCYRMVGSYDDSEDLVQDTLLKAWRNRTTFEGRSTLRAWLYKIATNTALDFLRRNDRRPQRYGPSPIPPTNDVTPSPFLPWLQPFPDEDPETAAETSETLQLIVLAAIQHLPPRQRAVLILRDVLGWPAADTATALDMTVASVNSALQRGRGTLRTHLPERRQEWPSDTNPSDAERVLLDRYMKAATEGDTTAMAAMLREDVRITMPPNPLWFGGRDAVVTMLKQTFDPSSPHYFGRWKHLPTHANGQPAVGGYVQRPGTRVYRAQVLDVLRVEDGLIVEITSFEPHLFPAFGLPLTVTD